MLINNINVSSICQLIVEELFGKFNYILPSKEKENIDFSRLLILYGSNGSGKTTLLQMLFHSISPEGTKGHRSFLRDIKFKKFIVKFNNGKEVIVSRKVSSTGPFKMDIIENGKRLAHYNFSKFKSKGREEKDYDSFLKQLKNINVSSYFLTDERDFFSDFISEDHERMRFPIPSKFIHTFEEEYFIREELSKDKFSRKQMLNILLDDAIKRAVNWMKRKVAQDSLIGESSINQLYFDIIKNIKTSKEEEILKEEEWTKLINDLDYLEKIIPKFSLFKFFTPMNIKNFKSLLNDANINKRQPIYVITRPYVDGLLAKIKIFTNIYKLIDNFVQNLNNFFQNKIIEFDYLEGIRIKSNSSDLDIKLLSSGEKQLLLLFCNLLPARDNPSIFIIDEPEISLNVGWQRDLIRALLELTEDSKIQFVFATHSIELLTQYEENVLDLKHIENI